MMTGVNNNIVANSRYFRYQTYQILILVFFIIGFNFLLIPSLGIVGAAVASAISVFIYSFLRITFVYRKFGMFPFDKKYLLVILISVVSYLSGWVIPQIQFLPLVVRKIHL